MSNSTDSTVRALEGFRRANTKVQNLILSEAEKRVQAYIGRIDSLNQRLSALCALLFAGAAVAATYTTNADKVSVVSIGFAGAASVMFAIGGAISCFALISQRRIFPGEKPSWWTEHGVEVLSKLKEAGAKEWLIEHREKTIDSLAAGVQRRAHYFNIAVVVGAVSGSLIALAAVIGALFGLIEKEKAPISSGVNFACSNNNTAVATPPVFDPNFLPNARPDAPKVSCVFFVR